MFNKLKDQAKAGIEKAKEVIDAKKGGAAKLKVLVFGATGNQGGAVAKALLADKDKYEVVAFTRDATKPAAKALESQGAKIATGNANDSESVKKALEGVNAVFIVTQFWEHFSAEKELAEGKSIVDAIKAHGADTKVVLSSLEDVAKVTGGKITGVHHFNAKGQIAEYLKESGLPHVNVLLSFYHQNFAGMLKPQKSDDGYTFTLPCADKPFNSVDVTDVGPVTKAIFDNWDTHKGKTYPLASDLIPFSEVAAILSKATGLKVIYNPVPVEVFASFPFPGAADLAAMFQFYQEGPCDRDPKHLSSLISNPVKLEAWATKNKDEIVKAWTA